MSDKVWSEAGELLPWKAKLARHDRHWARCLTMKLLLERIDHATTNSVTVVLDPFGKAVAQATGQVGLRPSQSPDSDTERAGHFTEWAWIVRVKLSLKGRRKSILWSTRKGARSGYTDRGCTPSLHQIANELRKTLLQEDLGKAAVARQRGDRPWLRFLNFLLQHRMGTFKEGFSKLPATSTKLCRQPGGLNVTVNTRSRKPEFGSDNRRGSGISTQQLLPQRFVEPTKAVAIKATAALPGGRGDARGRDASAEPSVQIRSGTQKYGIARAQALRNSPRTTRRPTVQLRQHGLSDLGVARSAIRGAARTQLPTLSRELAIQHGRGNAQPSGDLGERGYRQLLEGFAPKQSGARSGGARSARTRGTGLNELGIEFRGVTPQGRHRHTVASGNSSRRTRPVTTYLVLEHRAVTFGLPDTGVV
ncbi:MAG: hypothetical protein OXC01_15865 [Immundisolibacterales bacterium]|nr:hypothetical protein [Immundisolibacterales bacterium]